MKIGSIPFLVVFSASLLPIAGAFFNTRVYHLPAALVIGTMVIVYGSGQKPFTLHKTWITLTVFLFSFLFATQVFTGRGFVTLATGGYVLSFAYAFYNLFLIGRGISIRKIVKGITLIYKFFILGMIVEFILIILGKQPLLGELLQGPNSPGYKTYNGADLAKFFGLFQESGGLNSLLLGSQIAGMLSLFALIWFIGIRKNKIIKSRLNHSNIWILLSLLMLLITINGTVLLLLVTAIIIYGMFINNKKRNLVLCIIGFFVFVTYYLVSAGYLMQRIFNDRLVNLQPATIELLSNHGLYEKAAELTTFEFYIFEFLTPVKLFISLDWIDILIGVGAQYLRTTTNYVGGDFGFGAALLASGLVWMVALMACLFIYCFPALRPAIAGSDDRRLWSVLASINGLITILWLLSTIHYNQAFSNPGGMILFALHFALTIYCHKRELLCPNFVDSIRRIYSGAVDHGP